MKKRTSFFTPILFLLLLCSVVRAENRWKMQNGCFGYTLTRIAPIQQLSSDYFFGSVPAFCFEIDDCDECSFGLDFVAYCTTTEDQNYFPCDHPSTMELPFTIDELEIIGFNDCQIGEKFDDLKLVNCAWRFPQNLTKLTFRPKDLQKFTHGQSSVMSALMLRVNEWIDESTTYRLFPYPYNLESITLRIEESKNEMWLVLAFIYYPKTLEGLISNPINKDCEYELRIAGPPGACNNDPKFELLALRESDEFATQFLDTSHYSLRIPPGCSPNLLLNQEKEDYPQFNETQEVCDGEVIFVTFGYLDYTFEEFPTNYSLVRNIFCHQYMNVTIEIIEVLVVDLQLSFLDENLQPKSENPITIKAGTKSMNFSYSKVIGIQLSIQCGNPFITNAGAAARVYVNQLSKTRTISGKMISKRKNTSTSTSLTLRDESFRKIQSVSFSKESTNLCCAVDGCPTLLPLPEERKIWYYILAGALGLVAISLLITFISVYFCCPRYWSIRYLIDTRDRRHLRNHLRNNYRFQMKNDGWEVDIFSIEISEKKLGSGAFAVVHKGTLKELPGSAISRLRFKSTLPTRNGRLLVAIKMCHEKANNEAKEEMLKEIDFMMSLTDQPHLLIFLGCSRNPENPVLITELCEKGELLTLLRKSKEQFFESRLRDVDLTPIAWQISDALLFLASKRIIHRDVAARNVLLTAENVAKLADFGLCRKSEQLLYTSKGGLLPIKWMAPESINSFEFSEKSDVWSFGVFLFELYTFGSSPFVSVSNKEMLDCLKDGNRLGFPEETDEVIKQLASSCWSFESNDRPNFEEISSNLYKTLEEEQKNKGYYTEFLKNHYAKHKRSSTKSTVDQF